MKSNKSKNHSIPGMENEMMKGQVERLKLTVEQTFGRSISTSRHFDLLRDNIRDRAGVLFSSTTLKRFWGYLDEDVTPSLHTLDTLSQYAGWKDWDSFLNTPDSEIQSGPINMSFIDVHEGFHKGDLITLSWLPDRECRIIYRGDDWFEIMSALNTRLKAGDRFRCSHIIDGQPLFLYHLTRDGEDLGIYVCGRKHGIRILLA